MIKKKINQKIKMKKKKNQNSKKKKKNLNEPKATIVFAMNLLQSTFILVNA